jgi:hypothetical protein
MEDFKEKFDDLIMRGYLLEFYEEDRDYPITGKYKAFCVAIKKEGKLVLNHSSRESSQAALIVAHKLLEIMHRYDF